MPRDHKTGYECERCGAELSFIAQDTEFLSGVYHARICLHCKNEWDWFIRSHAVWAVLIANEARQQMLSALTCGDGRDRTDELTEAAMQHNAILTEIADVTRAWVEETNDAHE